MMIMKVTKVQGQNGEQATSDTDLTDAHRLPIGDVHNSRSLTLRPPSPALPSREP
ncbi:hypothetical protein H5410_003144 [Solanum commersonii]|uniref:Uncharacterized protein n=1 Tax=Solanum commersonii TaxID=4109 RepID=A0A9J6B479_SOLCO|nr:hypothetical protein H5410_003144 [Solanum commersonii]